MSTSTAAIVAAVAVLFAISSVMAMAETAFTRANRIRLHAAADDGDKRATRLLALFDEPERTLNSVLLIMLVCQMTSATFVGSLLGHFGGWAFALGTVAEVFVFFTFSEVAPKTYAVKHPERAALRLSALLSFATNFAPLRIFVRGFIGLANVVLPGKALPAGPFMTHDEILAMVDFAADEDTIETGEKNLIHSVLEIGDTPVSDVMVPRTQMRAVVADATVDEAIAVTIASGFSRVPCYEANTDDIIGLVFLKDLVARAHASGGTGSIRSSLRDAIFVPESKKVDDLLREMQARKFHMAVVVDEYGGTAGLVTMEDLLEEIVGEITDEFDEPSEELERLADGRFHVPGRTPIGDLEEEVGVELGDEWDTVGGLVFNTLGHVPLEGECVLFGGFEFCAERMQGKRIVSVLIRRMHAVPHEHDADTELAPTADESA